jgi:cytochrome b subunit of formate dehydrogenase
MTTKPPLQRILQGILHHYRGFYKEFCTQKMKANKTTKGWEVSNHRRRRNKQSESSIDLAAHNQILNNKNS